MGQRKTILFNILPTAVTVKKFNYFICEQDSIIHLAYTEIRM